jgi:hypothetical protein
VNKLEGEIPILNKPIYGVFNPKSELNEEESSIQVFLSKKTGR